MLLGRERSSGQKCWNALDTRDSTVTDEQQDILCMSADMLLTAVQV